jgi:O-antigen/teichoic acid export membrane protein
MLLGSIGVASYYYSKDNLVIATSITILALCSVLINKGLIATAYLNGRQEFKKLFLYQITVSTLSICAIVASVSLSESIVVIIVSSSIVLALFSIATLAYIRRLLRNNTVNAEILSYGKHLNFLNMLSTILQNIDSILIFQLLGSHSLALYAMATPIIDRILGVFKTSYFFALPKFTEIGPRRARLSLYKRSFIAFLCGLIVVGVYILLAPIFFQIFFPKYLEAISLSIIFSLNIPLVAATVLPTAYVDSLVEIRNKYILHSIGFSVRITSLIACIYVFGLYGVIFSELLTRTIILCIMVVLIEKTQKTYPQKEHERS